MTSVIADDVMIHRETYDQHDRHLLHILNKCPEIGLKLNPDKCTFGETNVKFYGNIISTEGIKPDPGKVDVMLKMHAP